MDEQQRLRLLRDNPALIDIDVEYNDILDCFLERFKKEYDIADKLIMSHFLPVMHGMQSRTFSSVFSGPLVYTKDGSEKYTAIPDLLTFFFVLAIRLPQSEQKDKFFDKIWASIRNDIIPLCETTNWIYNYLIRMIKYRGSPQKKSFHSF
jgi:hypothetical protein